MLRYADIKRFVADGMAHLAEFIELCTTIWSRIGGLAPEASGVVPGGSATHAHRDLGRRSRRARGRVARRVLLRHQHQGRHGAHRRFDRRTRGREDVADSGFTFFLRRRISAVRLGIRLLEREDIVALLQEIGRQDYGDGSLDSNGDGAGCKAPGRSLSFG